MYRPPSRPPCHPPSRPPGRAPPREPQGECWQGAAAPSPQKQPTSDRWELFVRSGFTQCVATLHELLATMLTFSRMTHEERQGLQHSADLVAMRKCSALPQTFIAVVQWVFELADGHTALGPCTQVCGPEEPAPPGCGAAVLAGTPGQAGPKIFRTLHFLSPAGGGTAASVTHSLQSAVWCAAIHPPAERCTAGSRFLEFRYTRCLLLALAVGRALGVDWTRSGRRAAVLGGGAGSLASALLMCYPTMLVHNVEAEPCVAEAAELYFGCPAPGERLHAHCADAVDWLAQCEPGELDLLLVDVFENGKVPGSCQPERLAYLARRALGDAGVVAANVVHRLQGGDEWSSALAGCFPGQQVYSVQSQEPRGGSRGQSVLIAAAGPAAAATVDEERIRIHASAVSAEMHLPFDLNDSVVGYRAAAAGG